MNTDWWNYGGITRSVKILTYAKSHIDDYAIHLSNDEPDTIEGWVKIANAEENQNVQIKISELKITETVTLNKSGEGKFSIHAKPILWNTEAPKTYAVDFVYKQDIVRDTIGFRTIAVQGENILLNGKSIFLKGISIHEESGLHPGRAWSEEDAQQLLTWAKDLGCNFVRLAHYPHSENMIKMADKMGILVWSEIPVYWTVLFNNPMVYQKAEKQLTEMISRDKNRASVILWSMANETPNGTARLKFISQLAQKTRQLDDTRLITAALETKTDDKGVRTIDDPLSAVVDVIGINSYCGWYVAAPGSCSSIKWISPYHKPMIMSEFGGDALQGNHGDKNQRWTEEYQADVYINNLAMIDNIGFLRGVSPWVLKDFRSPRRPLPNIQDYWNRKGLVSDKGIKKKSWFILHDYYLNKKVPETSAN